MNLALSPRHRSGHPSAERVLIVPTDRTVEARCLFEVQAVCQRRSRAQLVERLRQVPGEAKNRWESQSPGGRCGSYLPNIPHRTAPRRSVEVQLLNILADRQGAV
jgi:hypothetical protein